MILLARRDRRPRADLDGNPQQTFGGLDITVRRNAFGRQRESFETDLDFKGLEFSAPSDGVAPVHAVFIRGPWVERVGPKVEVLAQVDPDQASHPRADFARDG
jgi:5'-phosphate synthase pdxT subunit